MLKLSGLKLMITGEANEKICINFYFNACNLSIIVHNLYKYRSKQRNTTRMKASKIRWTGNTGFAGEYYYDNSTHTLHDKEDYFSSRGVNFDRLA